MASCGEALALLLEAYGIDTSFGIPGSHTIELYRGIPQTRIRHVTPRHEQGAGFMADGYARACGRAAACITVSGPGAFNIATAMGQALQDSRTDVRGLHRHDAGGRCQREKSVPLAAERNFAIDIEAICTALPLTG